VPFAIPGEQVRVEIIEERPTFVRARLVEVLSASPERVTPVCKHFGECGGCHYQHMSYPAQLKGKRQIVTDQLTRIGGIESPNVLDTIPSPNPLYYRNHVQFSQASDGKLGYIRFDKSANEMVLPITECHIAQPEIMELFYQIDVEKLDVEQIGVRVGADEAMVVFESETGEPPDVELDLPISVASVGKDGQSLNMIGSQHLIHEVRGRAFQVSPASFFQVNTPQAEQLVGLVLEALGLSGGETVLDLYSGVGLFSAFIAPVAARVIGVEAFSPAVRDAEVNLDEFDNIELYESPVEIALEHIAEETLENVSVVLDPPRAGCDKAVIEQLLRIKPKHIVYVSCDPATLARDAKRLAAGGYRLISAQPLDMFPQTYHVETVAVFEPNAHSET
jgi:23S rRNA (uracil1939-C5)-methyltransferase